MNIELEKNRLKKAKKVLELIEKFEERIDTMKGWTECGVFPVTNRNLKDIKYAESGRERLEKYYHSLMKI